MPAPCSFGDIGKACGDLFKKKYDFTDKLTLHSKASNGLKLELGATKAAPALDATLKATYKAKDLGEFEGNIGTANKASATKAKVKFNSFYDGADVSLTASAVPDATLEGSYKHAMCKVNTKFSSDGAKHSVSGDLSVGMDGLVAGVAVASDLSTIKDWNVGAQYTYTDYTVALKTAKQRDSVTASLFHKYSKTLQWGAAFDYGVKKQTQVFTVGTAYSVSKDCSARLKINSAGVLSAALENKLSSPNVVIGLAGEFDEVGSAAKKFGVTMTFGQ